MMKNPWRFFAAVLFCCALPGAAAMGETMMILQNGLGAFAFDAQTGALVSMENKVTGTSFAFDANASGLFDVAVDLATGDIWKTHPERGVTLTAEVGNTAVAQANPRTLTVQTVHTLAQGEVAVLRTYALAPDSAVLTVSMEIENRLADAVVLTAQPLSLLGFADTGRAWSLLWPWKEGEIHADAVRKTAMGESPDRSAGYPVPFSMQFAALFDGEESLYFGVHDASAGHKNFFFRRGGESAVDLGGTQWPYVAPGETKACAPVVIALQRGGGWENAADQYRAFLDKDTPWTRELAPIARDFVGWYPYTMTRYENQYRAAYVGGTQSGMPLTMRMVSLAGRNKTGVPMTLFLGWHKDGFDSRYPDYAFDPALGGEEGFRAAAADIHADGGQVMMYMNNHLADTKSEWYQQPNGAGGLVGLDCAVKTPQGGVYHEEYGTGLDYVAMCPSAQPWIDANVDAVRRLRQNGTDAIWLDQMMEMPSALCYDPAHGHDTPATAYEQGYANMMRAFNREMEAMGGDYLYGCEGVCDAYIQWIDISGLMWARLLGHAPESAPQITRYTLPCKILGLPDHSGVGTGEYAGAFMMGEPFLARDSAHPRVKEYVALYQRYPGVYLRGRYMSRIGLAGLPDTLMAGVLLGEDGQSGAIQLFNPGAEPVTASLTYHSSGEMLTMLDAFTGESRMTAPGICIVTVMPNETAAIYMQWEGTKTDE